MNIINGTSGNDSLTGGSGSDYLDGGAGADTMSGMGGDDVYIVDNQNDVVIENPGGGTDRVNATVSYTLDANIEDLWLVGSADISGVGNGLGNTLWGNGGINTLDGQAGNDYIDGGAGADAMSGGTGDDTYWVDNAGDTVTEYSDEGIDTVNSTLANYTLPSNVENLILIAGAGNINGAGNALNNILTGNEGNNVLVGGAGNDSLDGGAGADAMTGGTGDDAYRVDDAGDTVIENVDEGTDTVTSTLVNYTLSANVENLSLGSNYYTTENLNGVGNELGNTLRGNSGNNTLDGGAGDDTLVGGNGNDTLTGGSGNDVFYLSTDDTGTDTITDLASGDVIQVCGTFFSGSMTQGDGTSVNSGEVQLSTSGGQTILHIGTDETVGADINVVLDGVYSVDNFYLSGFEIRYDTNHAPVLSTPIADQQASEGGAYTLHLPTNTFTDADGDTLTYTAALLDPDWGLVDLPSWLTFNATIGTFSGTPAHGDVGSFMVMVTATDPAGASSSGMFTLAVDQANIINGTINADTMNGTSGNDIINGLAGNDTLTGNAGNDRLDGGLGADIMLGGAGNDTYAVDNVSDKAIETTTRSGTTDAGGTDTVESSISWMLGSFIENLALAGSDNVNGTGNALSNTLTGNSGNNILDGKAGADILIGGLGNDTYIVDNAGDTVTEGLDAGTDLVQVAIAASGGAWTLSDNIENATLTNNVAYNLTGNELDNVLTGNGLVNTLVGGAGNDTLNGGAGADLLYGGAGNDTYVVDNAGDKVYETVASTDTTELGGTDIVRSSVTYALGSYLEDLMLTGASAINGTGNALDNVITGNNAANKLNGLTGNDTLNGAAGADTLTAGDGDDNLLGGVGNDILWGGTGADHFVFDTALSASANVDKIMDFNEGEGDLIALSSAIFAALGGSVAANEIRSGAGLITAATVDQHLIYNSTTGNLYYDKDGAGGTAAVLFATVDLVGIATSHPASMTAADFLIGTP